jgi:hypothetical protein
LGPGDKDGFSTGHARTVRVTGDEDGPAIERFQEAAVSQHEQELTNVRVADVRGVDAWLRRMGVEPGTEAALALTRRAALGAFGGLTALVLAACNGSGGGTTALPNPVWGKDGEGPRPSRQANTGSPGPTQVDSVAVPTDVIPRSQWASTGVARPKDINPMNGIRRITVHHDGISGTVGTSEGAAKSRLEAVRRSHVNDRGWADIGYHYVIDPAGRIWEARNIKYQGAHVKDNNENNLGVMVMGNFDEMQPTPQALASLDRFVAGRARQYNVPVSKVYTHQEINPTACPGRSLQAHMVQTRRHGGSIASAIA